MRKEHHVFGLNSLGRTAQETLRHGALVGKLAGCDRQPILQPLSVLPQQQRGQHHPLSRRPLLGLAGRVQLLLSSHECCLSTHERFFPRQLCTRARLMPHS